MLAERNFFNCTLLYPAHIQNYPLTAQTYTFFNFVPKFSKDVL